VKWRRVMEDKVYDVYCQFRDLGGVELVETFEDKDEADYFVFVQQSTTHNHYFIEERQ